MSLKCYLGNKEIYNIDNHIELSAKDHFVDALVNKKSEYLFSIELNDKRYEKEDIFILRVNIDQVGVIYFYIDNKTLDKNVFGEIKKLKDIEITNNEDAINKITKLIDIMNKHDYLFILFNRYKTSYDVKDTLVSLTKDKYIITISESCLSNADINHSFKALLTQHKYRWILLSIGGIILTSTSMYSAAQLMVNNLTIFIFMLITALAGVAALTITHLDYWDNKPLIKSKESILMLIFDALSIILGYLAFYGLFFTLGENELSFPTICLIALPILVVEYISIIVITCFIKKRNKN